MLETIPTQSTMTELLGPSLFEVWQKLCSAIDEKYEMERIWDNGGKRWTYEYKISQRRKDALLPVREKELRRLFGYLRESGKSKIRGDKRRSFGCRLQTV